MDMLEWLKPIIDNRSEQLVEESIEGEAGVHYRNLIKTLNSSSTITADDRYVIENIFLLHTKSAVECAYRSGLSEAIKYLK